MTRLTSVVALALGLASAAHAADRAEYLNNPYTDSKASPLKGERSDAFLRVPEVRSEYPKAVGFKTDFEKIDKKLTVFAYTKPKNLSEAQVQALYDARNLAVREFDEGLRRAGGGELSPFSEKKIALLLTSINAGFESVTARDQINTMISYAGQDPSQVSLHFRSHAQRRAQDESWSSYSAPRIMRAGTYEFRVSSARKAAPCFEDVVVVNDPTKQGVCAGYRP